MKAGNSIIAVFFFYMAFRIPMEINTLSLSYDTYDIPEIDFYKILSVILFGVCIILGCVSLEYGRNDRRKDVETVEKQAQPFKEFLEVPLTPVLEEETEVVEEHPDDVDKSLPVFEVIKVDEDNFDKISKNIDAIIGSE